MNQLNFGKHLIRITQEREARLKEPTHRAKVLLQRCHSLAQEINRCAVWGELNRVAASMARINLDACARAGRLMHKPTEEWVCGASTLAEMVDVWRAGAARLGME